MELSDSSRMKRADAAAIHERKIDSLLLMETAASFVAEAAAAYLGVTRRAVIFCGAGNNGGDGVAAARILKERHGASVRVFLAGRRDKMTADCRAMEARLSETGLTLEELSADDPRIESAVMAADVIIDALFGVGLSRPLEGLPLAAVRLMNRSPAPVVAADIASGVSADTGLVLGEAVRASATVTFSRAKPGHFIEPGILYRGALTIADIGIPDDLVADSGCGVYAVRKEDVSLPRRGLLSHKGDHGKLLVAGGSVGYTGAPSLCARAAVRAGAGLVWLGVPKEIYPIEAVKNDEAMPFPLPFDPDMPRVDPEAPAACHARECTAIVVGPGLGRKRGILPFIRALLGTAVCPIVLDADALWAVSQDLSVLDNTDTPVVLTPHEGEFQRLIGRPVGSRLNDARQFAVSHHCAVVLKGHRTICAFPDGAAHIIDAGGPGMAKGGTGDVLAGVIGAMLGQLPFERAVITACWLHARAGDIAARDLGEYAMTASDMIGRLSSAQLEILEAQ